MEAKDINNARKSYDEVLNEVIDAKCCNMPRTGLSDFRRKIDCIDRSIATTAMGIAAENAETIIKINKDLSSMIVDGFDLHFDADSLSKMTCMEILARVKWFSEWSKRVVNSMDLNQSSQTDKLLNDIIGMVKYDAVKLIEDAGYTWRITRCDKNDYIITCDLHLKRFNLEIDNDLITKTYLG
jgi:hypothetical protein